MLRNRTLPLILALLAGCAGEPEEEATVEVPPNPAAEAVAEIAAVAEHWEDHYNQGHPEVVTSVMIEDGLHWTSDGAMLFGRDAVTAAVAAEIEAYSPQIEIEQDAARVSGDWAVARGTYAFSGTSEDGPVELSGYWMTHLERVDGEWMLHGIISNADSPDQPLAPGEAMPMPEAEGADLLAESAETYETLINQGDAAMVADLYTDGAIVMGSGEAMISGRDEILARLTEFTEAGMQVDIRPWAAREFGDRWVVGAGTYTLESPDEGSSEGHFAALYERGPDGLKLEWLLTAVHPDAM